jgi:hypothetical protein
VYNQQNIEQARCLPAHDSLTNVAGTTLVDTNITETSSEPGNDVQAWGLSREVAAELQHFGKELGKDAAVELRQAVTTACRYGLLAMVAYSVHRVLVALITGKRASAQVAGPSN